MNGVSCDLVYYTCATLGFVCVLPWGIPQLQSDCSLPCDHGLDSSIMRVNVKTTTRLLDRLDYSCFTSESNRTPEGGC